MQLFKEKFFFYSCFNKYKQLVNYFSVGHKIYVYTLRKTKNVRRFMQWGILQTIISIWEKLLGGGA